MKLTPINDSILFEFVDEALDDSLVTLTASGIAMTRDIDFDEQKEPRWATVVAKGDNVKDPSINVGEFILIEPLQWTVGVEFEGSKIWKTDESKVMLTSQEMQYRY